LSLFANQVVRPISFPAAPRKLAASWYAIQTRSRFEKVVRDELNARGIENYLPSFTELHQWKDRKTWVEQPIFPGYIFARFVDEGAIPGNLLRTRGAVRILGHGGTIEPVPDREIDSVQRLLNSGNRCFAHSSFCQGAWVRIKRGALTGIEGLLVRVKDGNRLVLSINLLSQSIATEVDVRDVEVIRPKQLTASFGGGGKSECIPI